jgi:diguanylate cyclase (GGDEF)-like protein/PAS domain S-box-containing protein
VNRGQGGTLGRHLPLSRIVFVRFAAAQLVLLLLLALLGAASYVRVQEARSQDRLNEAATAIARQVDGYLLRQREGIENLALSLESVPLSDRATLEARFRRFHEHFPSFRTLIAVDRQGSIVAAFSASSPDGPGAAVIGQSVADRQWFRAALNSPREGFVSGVFEGRGFSTAPIVAVSAPFWGAASDEVPSASPGDTAGAGANELGVVPPPPRGPPRGVVESGRDLAYFNEVVELYQQVDGAEIVVLDADGRVVHASPSTGLAPLDRAAWSVDKGLQRERPVADPVLGFVSSTARVPVGGWTVLVRWHRLAVYRLAMRWVAIAGVLLLVFVACGAWLTRAGARHAMAPLERLASHLRKLASGTPSSDQLEQLASDLRKDEAFGATSDGDVPLEVFELEGALAALSEQLHHSQEKLSATLAERDRAIEAQKTLLAELEFRVCDRTAELQERAAIQEAVAYAARSLLETGWQGAVERALERLGRAVNASRVSILENRRNEQGELVCSLRFSWSSEGAVRTTTAEALQNLRYHEMGFGRWEAMLERGVAVHGPVADFPRSERPFLLRLGIRSIVAVPIRIDGSFWGFLGLDDCISSRNWEEPVLDSLYAAARMLGAGLARDRTERALRSSETRYREIFEHGFGIVMTYTLEGKILSINPVGARGLGATHPQDLIGRALLDVVPEAARSFVRDHLATIAEQPAGEGLVHVPATDGGERIFSCRYRVIAEGESGYVVGQASDVTEKRRAEVALEHRAHHDPLTGCANRSLFETRLEHAIAVARRRIGEGDASRVAVMFLDLDDFKLINDRHGHAVGDRALREFGERFRLRVPGIDLVARLGGDEFGFILSRMTDRAQVEAVALSLLATLQEPLGVRGAAALEVGASLGIAFYPDHGDSVSDLVARADAAMYRAKEAGKNRFAYASGGAGAD